MKKHLLVAIVSIALTNLISCKTFDRVIERCTINTDTLECYCHPYRLKKGALGRVGETSIFPIEYCDKLIGVHTNDWADLYEGLLRELKEIEDTNIFLESR